MIQEHLFIILNLLRSICVRNKDGTLTALMSAVLRCYTWKTCILDQQMEVSIKRMHIAMDGSLDTLNHLLTSKFTH